MTIDGAVDIRENRNNASNINDLEHGRTYSFGTTLIRNSNLAFNLGYSYNDLYSRITATVGYSGTFTDGDTLFLNPRILPGTLAFNYQKPFASIEVVLYKGLSYKSKWEYYGYNLKTPMDLPGLQPIGSQDFNGSTATFGARYTF